MRNMGYIFITDTLLAYMDGHVREVEKILDAVKRHLERYRKQSKDGGALISMAETNGLRFDLHMLGKEVKNLIDLWNEASKVLEGVDNILEGYLEKLSAGEE